MMMVVVFLPWCLPVSGREWLSKTKKVWQPWAAESYFQDLEMICFALFILESKVGPLSTPIMTHWLGPCSGQLKLLSIPTILFPVFTIMFASLPPLSQGIMALCKFQGPWLRLLFSMSVVPFLESTSGISMWGSGLVPPSGSFQQRRTRRRTLKTVHACRHRLWVKKIPKHLVMLQVRLLLFYSFGFMNVVTKGRINIGVFHTPLVN